MAAEFKFTGLDEPFEADWPVSIDVPQNGGTVESQTFTARFRLIPEEELEALKAAELAALDGSQAKVDHDFIRAFFVGFAANQALGTRSEEETIDLMLKWRWVRLGLHRAYNSFQAGIAVKN